MDFCYVNPDGGAIEVKITVDNGARSNWNCALASKEDSGNWKAIESFKMNSGDDGTDDHSMKTQAKAMEGISLLWKVTSCAEVQGVERAKFLIELLQDGSKIYEKESDRLIPQCAENKAAQFKSMLAFKLHSDHDENVDIWDVLS